MSWQLAWAFDGRGKVSRLGNVDMKRKRDQLRRIEFIGNFTKHAAGSVLVKWGDTWVLCSCENCVRNAVRAAGEALAKD